MTNNRFYLTNSLRFDKIGRRKAAAMREVERGWFTAHNIGIYDSISSLRSSFRPLPHRAPPSKWDQPNRGGLGLAVAERLGLAVAERLGYVGKTR